MAKKKFSSGMTQPVVGTGQVLAHEIQSSSSPGAAACCLFVFALILTSIAGTMLYYKASIGFPIFLGVAALVLFALMIPFLIAFLQSRSVGKLHLETDAPAWKTGELYPIHVWQEEGKKLSHPLSVQLVCQEWVSYREGTNTRTETKVIYTKDSEGFSDEAEALDQGKWNLAITVPANAASSFYASHNSVHWELHLLTRIWGMKYKQEFPVKVVSASMPAKETPVKRIENDYFQVEKDRYMPGEVIRGTWKLALPPVGTWDVMIEIGWQTEGKGDTDNEVVASLGVPVSDSDADWDRVRQFELILPEDCPCSYDGDLIRIGYLIHFSVRGEGVHKKFDISEEITIGDAVSSVHWPKFAR